MTKFEDLINGCKKQDPQSMLELYNLCSNTVYNTCLHIVSNEFDAEEIMQDAILKAFDNINKFLGNRNEFIAFVKKIAVNKCLDWHRKNKKTPFFDEINDQTIEIPEDNEDIIFPIETIKEKIEELPEGYKMVIKLHILDDMDFVDIAEIMKIQPSSVRSQFVRAKNKLRNMLNNNILN